MKIFFALLLLSLVTACGTPLVIVGQGSVLSSTGKSDCTYADFQAGLDKCKYNWLRSVEEWDQVQKGLLVPQAYSETYYAIPKPGWAVQSMILAHKSKVATVASWSNSCKPATRNECPIYLPSDGVKNFLSNNVNPVLTTKFIQRTNELTVNSVFPSKIYASNKLQRIIVKGEGFLSSDKVSLINLSNSGTTITKTPAWRDVTLGLMVIKQNFTATPSRWLLKISRQDNSQTFTIPFDVVSTLNVAPFLASPIDDLSCANHPCNPYEAKISSVVDHSGTPLDTVVGGSWTPTYGDHIVTAYTGEKGDQVSDGNQYPGYTQVSGEDFIVNGNYTGAGVTNPMKYLNYDGHAGFDFPYGPSAKIKAAEEGYLFRAETDSVIYGSAWQSYHAYYILHENGMSTWYLHSDQLDSSLSDHLGSNNDQPIWVNKGQLLGTPSNVGLGCLPGKCIHLHFEVRKGLVEIVDPYAEHLWSIVYRNGREWLQPALFTNLSWNDININALCPAGVCNGTLNGHDVTGWTLASLQDVHALLNFYIGAPVLGSVGQTYSEVGSVWAPAFFADFRPTESPSTNGHNAIELNAIFKDGSMWIQDSGVNSYDQIDRLNTANGVGQIIGALFYRVPDIIRANGKEWMQPSLFTNLPSWNDINAVCPAPAGVCSGTLNGYDMTGWTWASVNDVFALFNSYGISPPLAHPGSQYLEIDSKWAPAFFDGGWRPTYVDLNSTAQVTGYTRDVEREWAPNGNPAIVGRCTMWDQTGPGTQDAAYYWATTVENVNAGGWFFRQ